MGIYRNANPIKAPGASMKIIKMDRRFARYHEGFTHQIRGMTLDERRQLESYFVKKYGSSSDFIFHNGVSQREYNTHWRREKAQRSYTGGTKIYVKHEQDLVMLGLKFNLTVQRA